VLERGTGDRSFDALVASVSSDIRPRAVLDELKRLGVADEAEDGRVSLLAGSFACYSGQWLAVVGFLPTIYRQAGVGAAMTGVLTALAAAANIVGNVGAGRLLHRGWPPPRLLALGFVTMAAAAVLAFAAIGQPAWARYAAVLLFSAVGGLIPGTLFALVVRLAPGEHTLSSTVGWMQQWSALGQFAGPPLVAWLLRRTASPAEGFALSLYTAAAALVMGLLVFGGLAWRRPLAVARGDSSVA
jgi:MFS family permease